MAQQVQAPRRKPRVGGIKTVVDGFIREDRLSVVNGAGGIAWEDSGCGLPSATRAGCYDDTVPEGGTNEVQTLTITGTPTGGTFTLTFDGQTTVPIAYNATAPTVQAALEGLSNIEPGDVDVAGGPAPGTPFTFTFGGRYATENVPQMTADSAFTGGAAPAANVTTTTPGVAPKTASGVTKYTSIIDPFALYKGVECYIGGDDEGASYQDQARAVPEAGEDRALENRLYLWGVAGPSGAAADTIEEAIGRADAWADANYVGRPVMMLSQEAATLAYSRRALEWQQGVLVTPMGTPVISGGSVGITPVVVIGQPEVYATEMKSYVANDLERNKTMAIAERVYTLGVDCNFRHAIAVTAP